MQKIYVQIHLHSKYFAKCFCGELHYLSRIAKPRRIKYSDEWAISNLQTKTVMVGFAKIDNIVQRGMFCSKSNTNFISHENASYLQFSHVSASTINQFLKDAFGRDIIICDVVNIKIRKRQRINVHLSVTMIWWFSLIKLVSTDKLRSLYNVPFLHNLVEVFQ